MSSSPLCLAAARRAAAPGRASAAKWMRYSLILLFSALSLPLVVSAGSAAPESAPARAAGEASSEVQDLVYFAEKRPYVIRMYIEVDGKSFQARWENYIGKLFRFLDRDNDGVLSEAEAERATGPGQFMQQLRGQAINPGKADGVEFTALDDDGDQRVTLDELMAYYRSRGCGPTQAQPQANRGVPNPMNDVLFSLLDQNGDGKLSRAEVMSAAETLRKLDQNDDELISAQELMQGRSPNLVAAQMPQLREPGAPEPKQMEDSALYPIIADGSQKRLVGRSQLKAKILARYDANKDGKLDRSEIDLEPSHFKRLDRNQNGQLDNEELLQILNPPADIEVTLRLGKTGPNVPAAQFVQPEGKTLPFGTSLRSTNTGSLVLTMHDAQIELRGFIGPARTNNARQFLMQQFRSADQDKQGFVTEKQLAPPQFAYLKVLFDIADRDNDKKLTEKELSAYVDLLDEAGGCAMNVATRETGRTLFEIVDANRDGRLGPLELKRMWSQLAGFADEGAITPENLPRQLQVTMSVGQISNSGRLDRIAAAAQGNPYFQGVSETKNGPMWFRKMDRNGDGLVSPREFLGSVEDFKRIDTNNDGYITSEEAEQADKLARVKK